MNRCSGISWLAAALVAAALAASGCGSNSSSKSSTSTSDDSKSSGLKTIVGRPVSVTGRTVVIETEDGDRRTFTIARDDLVKVDPGHIASHIGFRDLAFRIYYREVDGKDQAVESEEVDLQAEAVDQTR